MSGSIDNERFRNLLFSWPEKALKFLYDQFYDDFIRIADMHTHDRRGSEDVLQEVFADVWERHKSLGQPNGQSIQAYLIKAVSYHSITYYRRNARAAAREAQYYYDNQNIAVPDPGEQRAISYERQSFARLMLGTLPPREKECLLMQIDHGMRVKDIARALGISVKGVEKNLTSARKRLRRFRYEDI